MMFASASCMEDDGVILSGNVLAACVPLLWRSVCARCGNCIEFGSVLTLVVNCRLAPFGACICVSDTDDEAAYAEFMHAKYMFK